MTILLDPPTGLSPICPNVCAPIACIFRRELIAEKERQRRRDAQESNPRNLDLVRWGQKYLPAYFDKPPSIMHQWLARQIAIAQSVRGTKVNLLGPRGGAKSTIAALALPLRAALERWEPYIWIVSDTAHQACAHLENVKAELLDNPRLAQDYSAAVGLGPTWRRGSIVLRNGVTIEAFGAGQRLRGRRRREHRPTLIICDDLQNDSHICSALLRERSLAWFHGTLVNAGTPDTNIFNLATALHRQALAMQLHGAFGWISRIFRSIVRWPQNMSLWTQWETIATDPANPNRAADAAEFYARHQLEMHAGAILLWPEAENLYSLMGLRLQSGHTAFEREKQSSPINPDLCEWPESYFDETIWFDAWPTNLIVKTMALDPSKGSDARTSDYSALVLLGVAPNGILYVEADLARRPTPEIAAHGAEWFRRFQPDAFACESNQFQELLGIQFETEFRRQGIIAARPVPIENHAPKAVRIRRLGPLLSTHRLRFKADSPSTRLLVEQLMQFPIADHDDGPDALEMAFRLANQIVLGRTFNDGLGTRLPLSL
jgi:predicted phage terminase large subunit-like protein